MASVYLNRDPRTSETALHSSASPLKWHSQLGHHSLQKLKLTILSLQFVSNLKSEDYQLGKNHRVSFQSRVDGCRSCPIVHLNLFILIWGPTRQKILFGYSYFVTFVDDYLQMTWPFRIVIYLQIVLQRS